MTIDRIASEFEPAKQSVNWAKEAIDEFRQLVIGFFDQEPHRIVTELDTQTGEHVQKLRLVQPLPQSFRRKATEALLNLRHSFDQGMFAARNITSGAGDALIYFPWANGPKDLEGRLAKQGIDKRLWDVLASHEPYGRSDAHAGGDDIVRTLAKLANDKHTVGLAVAGRIVQTRDPNIRGGVVESLTISSPLWDPTKNEAELVRWRGDVEIDGEYRFSFQIVFQSSRFSQPVDALSGLSHFADKANAVIESLQSRCLELHG